MAFTTFMKKNYKIIKQEDKYFVILQYNYQYSIIIKFEKYIKKFYSFIWYMNLGKTKELNIHNFENILDNARNTQRWIQNGDLSKYEKMCRKILEKHHKEFEL